MVVVLPLLHNASLALGGAGIFVIDASGTSSGAKENIWNSDEHGDDFVVINDLGVSSNTIYESDEFKLSCEENKIHVFCVTHPSNFSWGKVLFGSWIKHYYFASKNARVLSELIRDYPYFKSLPGKEVDNSKHGILFQTMVDTKRFIFVGDGPYKGKSSGERKSSCTGQRLVKRVLRHVKQRLQERWDARFGQLEEYRIENGDCNVPFRYELNPQLGIWVANQRQLGKTKLASDRVAKLDRLGFQWSVHVEQWDVRFGELEEYRIENGDCNVPQRYELNPQLGTWVANQRKRREKLAAERIAKLDRLGFQWSAARGGARR
jgi:hypothetical protein